MLKLYDFNWKNYTFQALKQLPREKFKIATKLGIQKLEYLHYNWTLALSMYTCCGASVKRLDSWCAIHWSALLASGRHKSTHRRNCKWFSGPCNHMPAMLIHFELFLVCKLKISNSLQIYYFMVVMVGFCCQISSDTTYLNLGRWT